MILKCNIVDDICNNREQFTTLPKKYKWGETSKLKLIDVLSDESTLRTIVNFEDSQYDKSNLGIENATQDLSNIFEELAKKSCKLTKYKKSKPKKTKQETLG